MWVAVNHGTRYLCDMTNEKCKKGRNAKTLFSLLVHLHKNVNPIPGGTVPNPLQHGFEVAWQFFSSGSPVHQFLFMSTQNYWAKALKGFYRVSANFTAAYVQGSRGWISSLVLVRTLCHHQSFYREWIRKSFHVGREGLLKWILPCWWWENDCSSDSTDNKRASSVDAIAKPKIWKHYPPT